jgi:flagellar hook protein FlgE
MFIGRQGIATHQRAINLTTNNIANVNSIAFKKSSIGFASGISNVSSLGGTATASSGGVNGKVFGSGASVDSVSTTFSQGSLKQVGDTANLALQGRGFFVVSPTSNITDNTRNEFVYTRDGTFDIDADGNLVNSAGQFVMGATFYNGTTSEMKSINSPNYKSVTYLSDQTIGSSIDISTTPSFTTSTGIGFPSINTNAISELSVRSGLVDSPVDINDGTLMISQKNDLFEFSFTDTSGKIAAPDNVFSKTISTSFGFDSKSNTFVLRNAAGKEVQMRLRVKPEIVRLGEVFTGFNYDENSRIGSSLTFDSAANSPETQVGNSVTLDEDDLPYITAADMQGLIAPIKLPPILYSPDPQSELQLSKYNIGQDGTVSIEGAGTTGRMEIARLLVGNFTNYDGLINNGAGYYSSSANSGEAAIQVIGGPSTNENLHLESTQIISNTLEYSNVDLAQEMTKMIVYQRGLQGSARVVTVADELLQALLNL